MKQAKSSTGAREAREIMLAEFRATGAATGERSALHAFGRAAARRLAGPLLDGLDLPSTGEMDSVVRMRAGALLRESNILLVPHETSAFVDAFTMAAVTSVSRAPSMRTVATAARVARRSA